MVSHACPASIRIAQARFEARERTRALGAHSNLERIVDVARQPKRVLRCDQRRALVVRDVARDVPPVPQPSHDVPVLAAVAGGAGVLAAVAARPLAGPASRARVVGVARGGDERQFGIPPFGSLRIICAEV